MFLTKRCWLPALKGIRYCNKEQYPFKPTSLSSPILHTNLGTRIVKWVKVKFVYTGAQIGIGLMQALSGYSSTQSWWLILVKYKPILGKLNSASQHVILSNFFAAVWKNICISFIVNTPHFLTIKGVEVNAGQTASFHCTVNGRKRDNFRLWLQVRSIFILLLTIYIKDKIREWNQH